MPDVPRSRELVLPCTAADLEPLGNWVMEISQAAGSPRLFRVTPIGGTEQTRLTFHSTSSVMDNVGPRADATMLVIDCLGSA